jgi:hypothetical protein
MFGVSDQQQSTISDSPVKGVWVKEYTSFTVYSSKGSKIFEVPPCHPRAPLILSPLQLIQPQATSADKAMRPSKLSRG